MFLQMILLITIIILTYPKINSLGQLMSTTLDCSVYGVDFQNFSNAQQNWEARLRACFVANPYDITQIPASVQKLPNLIKYKNLVRL